MTAVQLTSLASRLQCSVERDIVQRRNGYGHTFDVPVYRVLDHNGTELITFYQAVVEDWMQTRDAERLIRRELAKKESEPHDKSA